MPWDPDDLLPLAAAPISVTGVEKSSNTIWEEFLMGWLDGADHLLRGAFTKMPALQKLTFQEMPIPKLDGLYLQVALDDEASVKRRMFVGERWIVQQDIQVHFYFRALVKKARPDGHNTISLVRFGSDTLYAILTSHQHVIPLQWCGMMQFRPESPQLVGYGETAMRKLSVNLKYVYPEQETLGAPELETPPDAGVVYIGKDRTTRVTGNGIEVKQGDNWFSIDVHQPGGTGPGGPTSVVFATERAA